MIDYILDFFRQTPTDYGARRVWAIGDLQGCYSDFRKLLDLLEFDPALDRLWLAGDLVNRGEGSLETLEYLYSIKDSVRIILGNHDITTIAIYHGLKNSNPTLDPIFESPRAGELIGWLSGMPFVHYDKKLNYLMVHAGIPPAFSLQQALKYSQILQSKITGKSSAKWMKRLLKGGIDHYDKRDRLRDRLRFAISAFTRMRFCKENGYLDYSHKSSPSKSTIKSGLHPWFRYKKRKKIKPTIIFGHWSTLGYVNTDGVICLDTGCVWSGKMSAIRIDDKSNSLKQVDCSKVIADDKHPFDSLVIRHFLKITQIPHCSHETQRLKEYILEYAAKLNYKTSLDDAGNIHIIKGEPGVCLQAHYDMVCIGKAPNIETYEEDGYLKAKKSSLGADNGIAIAMMLALMDEGRDLELLLTNDEEVGLVGAGALELDIKSSCMLNLDFEDEAELCVGCAGGADIHAKASIKMKRPEYKSYEITIRGLPGGHSGVDIDKGITSAIKLLAGYLADNDIAEISSISAGERINSIPTAATAIVGSDKQLLPQENIKVKELKIASKVYENSTQIINMLNGFTHGVIENNSEFSIPHTSINLAIVTALNNGNIELQASARSMDEVSLSNIVNETTKQLSDYGLESQVLDKYPPWKPQIGSFRSMIESEMIDHFGSCKVTAIHAGLECGVILDKYPHIEFASIGPTIKYPHSTREMLDLDSVERTYAVVKAVVEKCTNQ